MKSYSTYFTANTGENTPLHTGEAQRESVIFLSATQISLPNTRKLQKSEQNHIIRLATSIKKYGILEPLCIRLTGNSTGFPVYELIDGERRFRAAAVAGVDKLPCTVLPQNAPKCLQQAFISRLLQEEMHFFALAEAFLTLLRDYQMTQEEIARKMGLSQSAVANKLRLLRLLPEERQMILGAGLTERHARALLRLENAAKRREALAALAGGSYTVAETEALVEQFLPQNAQNRAKNASFSPVLPQKEQDSAQTGALEGGERGAAAAQEGHVGSSTGAPVAAPQGTTAERTGQGMTPRRFILRDLQPLYHSIERTLSIFEKTGATVDYRKQEDEHHALITISIPKKA